MHKRAITRIIVYSLFMLTQQRKTLLLDRLAKDGRLVAKDLARELGLSDDTIRRDLRELAADGKLQRVHGGALPSAAAEADLTERHAIASESKMRVGKLAATLIKKHSVVIIDGGTTAIQLIKHLPLDTDCTVVTHSPSIAVALLNHRAIKVTMIGGVLYRHSMVNVGAAAIESMSHIRADSFFMGVTGVSINEGLSTGDLEEACIKRALSERAAETIVLASEEKLEVASAYKIMSLENTTGIVLHGNYPKSFLTRLKSKGLDVYAA